MDYGLDLQWRPIFPRRIKRSSPSLYVNTFKLRLPGFFFSSDLVNYKFKIKKNYKAPDCWFKCDTWRLGSLAEDGGRLDLVFDRLKVSPASSTEMRMIMRDRVWDDYHRSSWLYGQASWTLQHNIASSNCRDQKVETGDCTVCTTTLDVKQFLKHILSWCCSYVM